MILNPPMYIISEDKIHTKETKYNIFKIQCSDCDCDDVGESVQILKKIIKQHSKNVDNGENGTNLANHSIKTQHLLIIIILKF